MRKTRNLILLLLLCCLAMTAAAQVYNLAESETDEDTINIISYFDKGDTMTYNYSHEKIKIREGDTTRESSFSLEFRIAVIDSTSQGYRMEVTPLSYEFTEEDSTSSAITRLGWSILKDVRCIFSTNEVGEIQHIENWREISKQLKAILKQSIDKAFNDTPELDSVMSRKQLERMLSIKYSSEEGIRDAYEELDMLFAYHGTALTPGIKEVDDTDGGYPCHIIINSGYTEIEDEGDYDGDYAVATQSVTTLPMTDALEMGFELAGWLVTEQLADSLDRYKQVIVDSLNSTSVFPENMVATVNEYYGYFINGWPKECRRQKVVDAGLVKSIERNSIIWTSRNWDYTLIKNDEPLPTGI